MGNQTVDVFFLSIFQNIFCVKQKEIHTCLKQLSSLITYFELHNYSNHL